MKYRVGNRRGDVIWRDRHDMVRHALALSMPWFTFVNLSFALMVYGRNLIFPHFDAAIHIQQQVLPLIDGVMCAIMVASVALSIVCYRFQALSLSLSMVLLLAIGLMWSYSCYYFIVWWHLPSGWPLMVILMLSALAALYYHPRALLLFLFPLWVAALVFGTWLNPGARGHFLLMWILLTATLAGGWYILQRWFSEAWYRYQENRLLIARLDLLAHQDALTGTANRRAMESYLNQALTRQQPFALVMLDVDHFKQYNDHYGHQAGDGCLAAVARVLASSVRAPADLVARYGGEEFVVILPEASLAEAGQVADRIQASLQAAALPHVASQVSDQVTVSMGIAVSEGCHTVAQVISRADRALYRAKQQGRNQWQTEG
ncbi:GGDEF domain-containing protein [Shimwellia blattae]|uniref:diguanylate cyclase n=1 Tax=Shimwellia blattae (strain ATCC 29907 / DSM 4481 / JCM 1650 / NBRC 105725 / CDC 9005-74) TaxID=630626 RepID=I2B9L9_SHIBC|nr:GGDEF domain-containing protein [Shimwellia blattae]AFJ47223.1 diguanylate cyclase (GGDEF) domain protein [Shimwellia blattae DSM 4481 = NBRC 105725]GAB82248.1 hypothetical protein EB105725_21_00450 [Shimwellia blattae DSM 4481 = NBRC 105725]VDY64714.1 Bacteriophytochrome cph2 [Shimwellia blattae]VEC22815.1 Bacteriophytochrome cph2 [Shimwellia blattae]